MAVAFDFGALQAPRASLPGSAGCLDADHKALRPPRRGEELSFLRGLLLARRTALPAIARWTCWTFPLRRKRRVTGSFRGFFRGE